MHGGDATILLNRIMIAAERSTERSTGKMNGREVKLSPPPVREYAGWRFIAAAAVIMAVAAWQMWPQQVAPLQDTRHDAAMETVTYTGERFVKLPDGSSVILNEGSRLSYTTDFGGPVREVTLEGEGYFDVRHNPDKPFRVLAGDLTTTVLGTTFNIKAYPGEDEVLVTVARGKVKVADDHQVFGILTRDQQITVNTRTRSFIRKEVDVEAVLGWKKDYLILDDISMREVASVIEAKYQVRVTISQGELEGCRLTATFLDEEPLEQVLDVITGVVNASYILEDKTVRITGGKGC